jgi:hypothetical protein
MSDEPATPPPPPDLPAPGKMIRRQLSTLRTTSRTHIAVIAAAYAIFALSLLLQPARWAQTPAYHNLLIIMDQQAWGTCFAVITVMLGAALWSGHRYRWVSVLALSFGLAITTTWCAAFVIRWLTNSSTTPETWVSWAVFDFMLLRALLLLGYEEVRVRVRDRGDDSG